MKKCLINLSLILASACLSAQTTVLTLQPSAATGVDAVIQSNYPSNNYGTMADFASWTWTFSSTVGSASGLIKFDLSSIPAGSTINSAYLSLYYAYNTGNAGQAGANDCYLQEITGPWTESGVTWNNQPSVSTTNEVLLAASTTTNQSYPNINVTAMTQDAVNNPASYYGWELSLLTMQTYRSMKFGSSDNSDSTIHPKLVITYSPSSGNPDSTCVTLKPGPQAGNDAVIQSNSPTSNFGTMGDYAAWAWTFSSTNGYARSLINFDLSSIPANATITHADLSLFYSYNTGNAGQAGTNDCYLERITSPWTEMGVNWSNQPTTSAVNQVYLPVSVSSSQSYPNIDVTGIVQDIWANQATSYGIEIRQVTETIYRSMKFGSSDNPDSTLWPELNVCYTVPSGIHEQQNLADWLVYPNPANATLTIQMKGTGSIAKEINVFDLEGRLVLNQAVNSGDTEISLSVSDLANGTYFIQCLTDKGVLNKKLVIAH